LPSLELIVNPGRSKIWRRLLIIIYLLTAAFVFYSSFCLPIKLALLIFIAVHFKGYWYQQKPYPELYEIKLTQQQWIITMDDGHRYEYNDAVILIHNMLFQVLKFSTSKKNKILILFNDQLSKHQLRLLHLKTSNIGI